ncbi:MAG: PIN domain-containing protein [Deltaproteobacteria bacterium]|nr:PIN domain-containing protein [Deltaproteobacteria bacterium]
MKRFYVLRLDEQISDTALDLLKKYRLSHGLLISDALIAATAIISDLSFVSKNQRDYRFIKDLRLLPYPYPDPSR